MNRRILVLKIFLITVLVFLGTDHTGHSQENMAGAKRQTTDWGQMFRGLQMRVSAPISIASTELIELNLEFQVTSATLEPHIEDIVMLPPGATATLDVYDEVTGKQTRHVWKRDDQPEFAPVRFDAVGAGDTASLSIRVEIPTPLVIVESNARCRLDLFVPSSDPSSWSGFVSSPVFDLTLIPKFTETETLTVVFPKECKLVPGPRLGYDSLSMDSLKIEHCKGLDFGWAHWSPSSSGAGSWDPPDDILPVAQYSDLPWRLVFEDGRLNISNKFMIFESTDRLQHTHELEGTTYRVLWEREYPFTLLKEEMDSMTIPDRERFSYHTYLMPRQVRVTGKGEVVTDESNPVPIECKIKRGYEVGYWVTINGEHSKPFFHAPRSPIYQLAYPPTYESSVKFEINLFQFRRDLVGTDQMDHPPRIPRLWASNALLRDTTSSVGMEQTHIARFRRQIHWRECRMPRRLEIDSNQQVIADMSDPIMVDFKESEGYLSLVRLQVGTDTLGFISTFLPDILCQLDPSVSQDSLLNVTLSLAGVDDSCPPPRRAYTFWSKEYQLVIPHAPSDSTEGGRPDEK